MFSIHRISSFLLLHKSLKQFCLLATALFIIGQPLVEVFNTYLDTDYEICDSTEEKEDKSQEKEVETKLFSYHSQEVLSQPQFLAALLGLEQLSTQTFYLDEYAKVVPSPPQDQML